MSIKISNKIKSEIIDDNERKNIESLLVQKSANKCFLCGGMLDSLNQEIEADHDLPVAAGGATDLKNLNLAHLECNRFKKANPSVQVKKFLPLKKFLELNPESNFGIVGKELFNIEPMEVTLSKPKSNKLNIRYGTSFLNDIPIYEEPVPNRGKSIEYCFIQIPIYLIFNDDVQPRPIKANHVFNLFQDLHLNPLHEPIGARLEVDNLNGLNKILMFDGQHKAVAKILIESIGTNFNDVKIDLKIYLNLTKQEATHLVNSIQSKIIKLGLTKSEFARKMGNEWESAFSKYEEKCQAIGKNPTENDFVLDAVPEMRKRRKEALILARLDQLISARDSSEEVLKIYSLTKTEDKLLEIKETTLFNKLLQKFLTITPLNVVLDNDDSVRSLERQNIRAVLDIIYEELFTEKPKLTKEKISQLKSQSSLILIVDYTKLFLASNLFVDKADIFFNPKMQTFLDNYRRFIKKYQEHPIWNHAFEPNKSQKVEKFFNLLKQNQSLTDVAKTITLTQGYCAGMEDLNGREFD
jgi:hypothetical protein